MYALREGESVVIKNINQLRSASVKKHITLPVTKIA